MIVIVYSMLVLLASFLLTALIRQYALQRKVLDIPNQRSSHSVPTPRGGGLAIVITFYVVVVGLFFTAQLEIQRLVILLAGLLVAGIGFWDDHIHVPARWRFLVHFLASLIVLYFLQGFPPIFVGQWRFEPDILGYIIGAFFLVWWLNLFNFMDGTDGIAASEAVFVAAALAGFLYNADSQLFQVALFLAVASAGFLFWNRPPAKIFMGDVGSGYLGFVLGVLVLMAAHRSPFMLFSGLVLFGVFFVDATYTLLYRIASGQKWYEAHCSHTYQHAAKNYGHFKVLIVVWLINLFWLLPVAVWISYNSAYSLEGLFVAYSPLIYLAYKFKAGSKKYIQ